MFIGFWIFENPQREEWMALWKLGITIECFVWDFFITKHLIQCEHFEKNPCAGGRRTHQELREIQSAGSAPLVVGGGGQRVV